MCLDLGFFLVAFLPSLYRHILVICIYQQKNADPELRLPDCLEQQFYSRAPLHALRYVPDVDVRAKQLGRDKHSVAYVLQAVAL